MAVYSTLADRCGRKVGQYANVDPNWVQFVKDHRNILLQHSIVHEISRDMTARYKYSLSLYFYDNNMDVSTMWIVMWLNGIPSDYGFKNVTVLLIPTPDILSNLKTQYESNKINTGDDV